MLWHCACSSSWACPPSSSSNLHSYARAVPRSVSPPGGRRRQRSRVALRFTAIFRSTKNQQISNPSPSPIEEQRVRLCSVHQVLPVGR